MFNIQKSRKIERRLSDPQLSLFDIPDYGIFADETFSKSLLTDLKFTEQLNEIQSLSSQVACMRYTPKDAEKSKYGTICIFKVDVFCGKDKLEVCEKDPFERERFFSSKLENTTRVIWIFSTSVRTIEAKLRVYQEYENEIGSQNILLLHEFEDIDDICNLSEDQQCKDLYNGVKLVRESIPVDELQCIVKNATCEALRRENIRKICNAVHVYDGDENVGTSADRSYVCFSILTVRRIKKVLAKETLEELARYIGKEICKGILRYIESKVDAKLKHQLKDFDIQFSEETLIRMTVVIAVVVISIIVTLFGFIIEAIAITVMAVVVVMMPIDVNSREWRNKIADEVYKDVIEKEGSIIQQIMPTVRKMCVGTQYELKSIMEKINAYKKVITLIDQTKLVNQWKKRWIIQDRKALKETCPSFLNYLAGEKNGQSVVVVFLQDDDKERVKEYFKRHSKYPVDDYEIVHVNNDFRNKSSDLEESESSLEKNERKKMQGVIGNMKDRILALHSNVVGLGVGYMPRKWYKPCFVLYCVDKSLVPFGEKALPYELEGYPVELRDDYVMFGHAQFPEDRRNESTTFLSNDGSAHLRVKSRRKNASLFENRFLTPALVAPTFVELYKIGALLAENPFSKRTREDVDPWFFKNDSKKVTNILLETCETRSGGVLFHEGKSIGLPDIQLVEEDDLRDGELFITNEGQFTKCAADALVGGGFTIAIDLPLPAGVFMCFPDCIIIHHHPDVRHLKEGNTGSGVLMKKSNQPYKLFGIAFAVFTCTKKTAVCNIKEILKEVDFFVYEK